MANPNHVRNVRSFLDNQKKARNNVVTVEDKATKAKFKADIQINLTEDEILRGGDAYGL